MKNKKVQIAVVAVICIAACLLFADPKGEKPWTWANDLSVDAVDEIEYWGSREYTLDGEQTKEVVKLINALNRFDFKENVHLQGSTPTSGITLKCGESVYHINSYGQLEMIYGEKQWWINDEKLTEYIAALSEG